MMKKGLMTLAVGCGLFAFSLLPAGSAQAGSNWGFSLGHGGVGFHYGRGHHGYGHHGYGHHGGYYHHGYSYAPRRYHSYHYDSYPRYYQPYHAPYYGGCYY